MSPIISKCACGERADEMKQGLISGRSVCPACYDKEYLAWKKGAMPHPDVAVPFGDTPDKQPGEDDFDDDEIF